jgi:cytochrome c556
LRRNFLAAGLLCALGSAALSQDAVPSAVKDEIFARKILMVSIDSNMNQIDWMLNSGKAVDLPDVGEHADTISIMLMAFPHLFPPATNQWQPDAKRDPGRDTYAAPALWTKFADFYRRAAAASQIAFKASRAKNEADFRSHFAALRSACDSCHVVYVKTGE